MRAVSRAALLVLLALAGAACAHVDQEIDDSDPAIKARVESALRGRKDLDARYVAIDVENGVVTISGLVPTQDQVRAAGKAIARVHGVDTVINNLAVQEE